MAPFLLALLLFAQDAPLPTAGAAPDPDAPQATALPRKQTVAPLPIQGGPVSPPTDDYGYVGWCAGAIGGYVDLYDQAMPEVIRIERAWPTPGTEDNIAKVYPAQKAEALANLKLFRRAMEAAERASPTVIQPQGAAAVKKGRAVWTGANAVPKAQLAQFWMSWSPPARCEVTAKALEARSNLFGQALTVNAAPPAAEVVAPAAPVEAAAVETPPVTAPAVEEAVADAPATESGSAIDDLLSPPAEPAAGDEAPTETATLVEGDQAPAAEVPAPEAAEPQPEPEPAEPAATPETAAPETAAPTDDDTPKAKPGLRDTLRGLRGPQ